jgi:glycosyltransferase involved in cell wall biosynthesis
LHTPTFVIDEINYLYVSPWRKAKYVLGGLRRGRVARPYWRYDSSADGERQYALKAREITAPSLAIMNLVGSRWELPADRLSHVPNLFVPTSELLNAPPDTLTRRITYVGRLEVRKGVIELAHAIRRVAVRAPDVRFRLVGRSSTHPGTGEDMEAHLRGLLGPSVSAVEFIGAATHDEVPSWLASTDICVFPSVWEASGYVCKEAMAAARGVIATSGSGMGEIIADGITGRLTPPRDVGALASAMLAMLADPAGRMAMGRAARAHVSSAYSPAFIAPLQEASYLRAISRESP